MKTFKELAKEFVAEEDLENSDAFMVIHFALWLEQSYAPAILPAGAQPGVSADASGATDNAAIASTVPAADNGGDVSFPLCEFPNGVVLHFSYEQIQNDRQLALALSNLMFGLVPKNYE